MPKFDYIQPKTLEQAVQLVNDASIQSRIFSGGTDLMVYLHYEEPAYKRVVDISRLPELKAIERRDELIVIGAGITFTEIMESQLLQDTVPFLVDACQSVGSPQIRNMGTLGGNVMNAAACADSLPALVCLDTIAYLRSPQEERRVPVSQLVVKPNQTRTQPGEILTHFSFGLPPAGIKTAFIKLGRRNAQAISRLSVAAMGRTDDDGRIDYIRLTPGAATPQTLRFKDVEDFLLGQPVTESLLAEAGRKTAESMIAVTGRRWSTEYKEIAIAALTEQALQQVFLKP